MMKFLNNVTQKKNILIISFSAGILASPVFFLAISIAMKIAIIVAATIFTYLALLVIKKIRAKKNDVSANNKKQPDASEDEGYDSANGSEDENEDKDKAEDMVISPEEQKKTEFQVQEELNARERERMERGWLGGSIDARGNPLPDQVIYTENSHLVFESQKPKQDSYVPMKSLPENMNGFYETIPNTKEDPRNTQHVANHMPSMESPPDNMDIFGNKLPYSPSTHVNMNSSPEQCAQKKLSATEWLLKNEPWVLKQCPVKMPATTEDILNQRS